jgi:hypothetical protein
VALFPHGVDPKLHFQGRQLASPPSTRRNAERPSAPSETNLQHSAAPSCSISKSSKQPSRPTVTLSSKRHGSWSLENAPTDLRPPATKTHLNEPYPRWRPRRSPISNAACIGR